MAKFESKKSKPKAKPENDGEESTAKIGHNSGMSVDNKELKKYVDKYERITDEIKGMNADRSDMVKELVGRGFDKKAFMLIIKERKMREDEARSINDIADVYRIALGMA